MWTRPHHLHPKTMPNDKSPTEPETAAQQETGGDCVSRLVVHLRSIAAGFALIGEVAWVILIMLSMVPLFLFTAKSMDETMGEWHVRIFGETLRDKFLHNA